MVPSQKAFLAPDGFPVPDGLICPICEDFYNDPVCTGDGQSYCRHCISSWFDMYDQQLQCFRSDAKRSRNPDAVPPSLVSPVTRMPMTSRVVTPNMSVRKAVASYLDAMQTSKNSQLMGNTGVSSQVEVARLRGIVERKDVEMANQRLELGRLQEEFRRMEGVVIQKASQAGPGGQLGPGATPAATTFANQGEARGVQLSAAGALTELTRMQAALDMQAKELHARNVEREGLQNEVRRLRIIERESRQREIKSTGLEKEVERMMVRVETQEVELNDLGQEVWRLRDAKDTELNAKATEIEHLRATLERRDEEVRRLEDRTRNGEQMLMQSNEELRRARDEMDILRTDNRMKEEKLGKIGVSQDYDVKLSAAGVLVRQIREALNKAGAPAAVNLTFKLQEQLDLAADELDRQMTTSGWLQSEMRTKDEELDRAHAAATRREIAMRANEDDMFSLQKQVSYLEEELSVVTKHADTKNQVEADLKTAKINLEQARTDLAIKEGELRSRLQERERFRGQISTHDEDMREVQMELERMKRDHQRTLEELYNQEKANQEWTTQNHNLREEIGNLTIKLSSAQNRAHEDVGGLQKDLHRLHLEQLSEISRIQQEHTEELSNVHATHLTQVANLQQSMRAEIGRLQIEVETKDRFFKEMQADLRRSQDDVNHKQKEIDFLRQSSTVDEADLARLRAQQKKEKEDIAKLEQAYDNIVNRIKQLESTTESGVGDPNLAKLRRERDGLEGQLKRLRGVEATEKAKLWESKVQSSSTQPTSAAQLTAKELQEARDRNQMLTYQLQNVKAENERLKKELDKLQAAKERAVGRAVQLNQGTTPLGTPARSLGEPPKGMSLAQKASASATAGGAKATGSAKQFKTLRGAVLSQSSLSKLVKQRDVIKPGTVLVCTDDEMGFAEKYESTSSSDVIGGVKSGEEVIASGRPVEVDGYMMVPIKPKGAVELVLFQVKQDLKAAVDPAKVVEAAKGGNLKEVKRQHEIGASLNASHGGVTPLQAAAAAGHLEVVRWLCSNGTDVNKVNEDYMTPMYMAAAAGKADIVRSLGTGGAKKDAVDSDGRTALYVASAQGHQEVVQVLVNLDASYNLADLTGVSPMLVASFHGQLQVVKLLSAAKADVDQRDEQGWAPLYAAAHEGRVPLVKCLLQAKADPLLKAKDGTDPLEAAKAKKHTEVVTVLNAAVKKSPKR